MSAKLAVTVGNEALARLVPVARTAAQRWGLPYVERDKKQPLEALLGAHAEAFLVLSGAGWALDDGKSRLAWSPGMAVVRVKRRRDGVQQEDWVVRLGELQPGDRVFDGTLGLGADALVCAHAAGPQGAVTGVEASQALACLVEGGLEVTPITWPSAPLEVVHGETEAVLKATPAGAYDVVILDPMFHRSAASSPAFELLRQWARLGPLTPTLLAQAQRVAKRWVVVKGGRRGGDLHRLGLIPEATTRTGPVAWARLPGRGGTT